jgi:hypothetical protein
MVFKDPKLADMYRKENITMDDLKKMVTDFETDIRENDWKGKYGCYDDHILLIYAMSKMAENIWSTRILPRNNIVKEKLIQVYCLDPGNVATDMNNFQGELSIE